jgi:predicted acylesterase/phospholipase RssA/CRP-like cAMP-binding protein
MTMEEPSTAARLKLLAARPMLRDLGRAVLAKVEASLESVHVPGGARVVHRGQTGVPLMLIHRGGLRASFMGADARPHVLFESFRGGSFGEALMLSGRASPIDVDAIRDTHLLCLRPDKFEALSTKHPVLMRHLARSVATRVVDLIGSPQFLASFCHKADRLPRSIALVSAGAEDLVRMRGLVADSLSRSCKTIRLTPRDARHVMESRAVDGRDVGDCLLEWFDGLSAEHDLVIFECELSDPRWSDFCLRQADRVMVLVDGEENRRSGRGMDFWHGAKLDQRSAARVGLAVVHPPDADLPRGGDAFAKLPGVARLHHVRKNDSRDASRLARWLSDRSVGLVLGGGGAYGIAHVGVLKALEEAGVPVDVVGGTSMGAIFAGGLAQGWSADKIMDHVRELFASRFALYDPTIPFTALLAGKKLDKVLRALFDDVTIVDLWIPFFCVATSIVQAQPEVHEGGRLRDAIRSSCSIPGLFPPFKAVRDLLVDGGLVDNLPIGPMGERCRGPLVAVDVFPYSRHGRTGSPGLLGRLLERVRPAASAGLPLFDTLVHATLAGSQRTTAMSRTSHPPALYLTPNLGQFGILDWRAYEALFQKGYECAKTELERGALPRALWDGPFEYPEPSSSGTSERGME